jgi:hypothetical protein
MTFLLAGGSHQNTYFFNIGLETSSDNMVFPGLLSGTDLYIPGGTSKYYIYQSNLSWNTGVV